MTRFVGNIRVEFLDPAQRSDIVYRGLETALSAKDSRRFQRVMLVSPGAILYRGDLPRCTYPLGLGYLGAMLERNGYDVRLLDCLVEGYDQVEPVDNAGEFVRYGLGAQSIRDALRRWEPDVIGVSSIFSNQSDIIEEIFRIARDTVPDALLITGGAHARYFPEQYLESLDADAVFLGESENTIVEFLDWANGARPLESLQGIVVRQRSVNRIFSNKSMPLIKVARTCSTDPIADLDVIPYPAWHLYNMERYFEIGAYQSPYTVGSRVAQLYTSRGCTAKCSFCTTTNFWGGKLRRRSPDNVVNEIRSLVEHYGIDEYHIQDDNITNDKEHARTLFRALADVKLPWCTPQGTALWRMDEGLLDLMRDAGCYQITFAIESGVQRVLTELIRKPLDLARTRHLVRYARDIGLDVHGFFIIGMPPMFGCDGETIDEMRETYRFACDAGFTSASFFTATPIVGSELLTECLRQGFVAPDTPLYRMSYKQGLIEVPGLWAGTEIAALAHEFNMSFNRGSVKHGRRFWSEQQY